MNSPTPELLHKMLRHDPETGLLFWRERTPDMFKAGAYGGREATSKMWNKRFSGKNAFETENGKGYFKGYILSKKYFSHRVIWAMHYGEWPNGQIDHINGIKTDNRISNLRTVSNSENQKNQTIPTNNTTGIMGVGWHKANKRWTAFISSDGNRKHIGCFKKKADAIAARKTAEIEYGFSENHGRLA